MMKNKPNIAGFPAIPHIEQYDGLWAIEGDRFLALIDRVDRMDLAAHFAQQLPLQAALGQTTGNKIFEQTLDGVAIIEIVGAMTKYGSSMSDEGSTQFARRKVRAAVRDEEIKSIVIKIDSPGGTVAGNKDLADEVAAAVKIKTVTAYIEDLGASAAYWIASQATKVYANEMALVGSIGTYGVLYDFSGAAVQQGVKATVIRAGEYKGMGTAGTEITDAQKAEYQRIIDQSNSFFKNDVMRGRSFSQEQMDELADGRVHVASDALELGLIDGVQSWAVTLDSLRMEPVGRATGRNIKGGVSMSDTTADAVAQEPKAPQAASITELKAALPGAGAEFICAQLEANATLALAQSAYVKAIADENAKLKTEVVDAKEQAEKAIAAKPAAGVEPLGDATSNATGNDGADPVTAWNDAVNAKVKGGMTKPRAISAVVKADPELHQAFIAASNS